VSFDRDLEMIRLKEREAFGWAMRNDASSHDQFGAANAWENYANTCKSLQDELANLNPMREWVMPIRQRVDGGGTDLADTLDRLAASKVEPLTCADVMEGRVHVGPSAGKTMAAVPTGMTQGERP